MTDREHKDHQASGRRVYEYVDGDGVVYWSFHKHDSTVSAPKRLVLKNRLGVMFNNFIMWLRTQA